MGVAAPVGPEVAPRVLRQHAAALRDSVPLAGQEPTPKHERHTGADPDSMRAARVDPGEVRLQDVRGPSGGIVFPIPSIIPPPSGPAVVGCARCPPPVQHTEDARGVRMPRVNICWFLGPEANKPESPGRRRVRGRAAVADPALGEDVGGRGSVVAEFSPELLHDGAHASGVSQVPVPPHLLRAHNLSGWLAHNLSGFNMVSEEAGWTGRSCCARCGR